MGRCWFAPASTAGPDKRAGAVPLWIIKAFHESVESLEAATAARRLSGAPAQVRTVRSAAVSKKS